MVEHDLQALFFENSKERKGLFILGCIATRLK